MTDIRALLQKPVQDLPWQGTWARVWLRPDVFSAQEYIVGAIAFDNSGIQDYRILTGIDRLVCIYGDAAAVMFDELIDGLRNVLTTARVSRQELQLLKLPEVFRVEFVGSLRTKLPGENLDRMLRDGTIPLEPDEPVGKKQRFVSRNSAEVVKEVLDHVRLRTGLSANQFICEDFYGDQHHQVGVNLVTRRAAGIVASGWYANTQRTQLEFLLAATKVEAYSAAKQKEKSALFFMRPTLASGLSNVAWSEVNERLGELEWQLEKKGARVVTHDNPETLAQDVVDWAQEYA